MLFLRTTTIGSKGGISVLLNALCWLQTIMAFGFFDSARLDAYQTHFPLYAPNMAEGNFYQGRTLKKCGTPVGPGRHACRDVPIVNIITSLGGLCLLGLQVARDDLQKLRSPFPLWILMRRQHAHRDTSWYDVIGHFLTFLALLIAWTARFVLTPVLIMAGTALALAATPSAMDIIFNSLAAGFICDIDNMVHTHTRTRTRNRTCVHMHTHPHLISTSHLNPSSQPPGLHSASVSLAARLRSLLTDG